MWNERDLFLKCPWEVTFNQQKLWIFIWHKKKFSAKKALLKILSRQTLATTLLHKNRACHSWGRCNGVCLVSGPDICGQSRANSVASTPAVTGYRFLCGDYRLFLGQCTNIKDTEASWDAQNASVKASNLLGIGLHAPNT